MSNYKKHTLNQQLRQPHAEKVASAETVLLPPAIKQFSCTTLDNRPTFVGIFMLLWKELQIFRKWAPPTASYYGTIMVNRVLKHFEDVPFDELDEEDVLEMWNCFLKDNPSNSTVTIASVVIRAIMDLAYQNGYTRTTLWGLPLCKEELPPPHMKSQDRKETHGEQLAREMLKLPKSISLETELALAKALLDNCSDHGELIGALIMLFTGARTSEATGFSYMHLVEVGPGYWALVRYDVSQKDSREAAGGGKTNNAFRLLPIPRILALLLKEREKLLKERFPRADIRAFPLACKGVDYRTRCTQKELNQILKVIYQMVGVPEDLMNYAYLLLQESPQLSEDCEKKATAYLTRHQFATVAQYCGLTPAEMFYVMGHTMEGVDTKKADFSNPDQFRKLAEKLHRRPLTQVFDNLLEYHQYTYSNTPTHQIVDDGPIEILFPEEQTITVTAMSPICGDKIDVTETGIEWTQTVNFELPEMQLSEPMSIRYRLWCQGQEAWEKVQDKKYKLSKPTAVINTLDWEKLLAETDSIISVVATVTPNEESKLKRTPLLSENEHLDMNETSTAEPTLTPGSSPPPAVPPSKNNVVKAMEQYAVADRTSHILLQNSNMVTLENSFIVQSTGLVGKRPSSITKHDAAYRVITYTKDEPALVLSPKGCLYRLYTDQALDGNDKNDLAYKSLKNGGILLQGAMLNHISGSIVCLADSGQVRRISLQHLQRFPDEGRQLVTLTDGESIVSACLCSENCDVMLVSKRGHALRLKSDALRAVSTPGSGLYPGLSLRSDDRAVACISYEPEQEYLLITKSGMAVRMDKEFQLLPHGRNSQGVSVVKTVSHDHVCVVMPVPEAVLFVNNKGNTLCVNTEEIRSVRQSAKGVTTMRLKPEQYLLAAVAMKLL